MPVVLASSAAALSLVREKEQRTLESILATPLSDRDLLLAKLVAAVDPAAGDLGFGGGGDGGGDDGVVVAVIGRPAMTHPSVALAGAVAGGLVVRWLFASNVRRFRPEETLTKWR